jgi:hypothetical protein
MSIGMMLPPMLTNAWVIPVVVGVKPPAKSPTLFIPNTTVVVESATSNSVKILFDKKNP